MTKIRIGNTFDVLWAIYTGDGIYETPYDMTGKNISLYLKDSSGNKLRIPSLSISKHIISWRFQGKDQKKTGNYTLTLVENEGADNMYTVDECDAFTLVSRSCQISCECDGNNDNLQVNTLEFRSKISFGLIIGGSSNIEVDSQLSLSSENPVQNKVITSALSDIDEIVVQALEVSESSKDAVDKIEDQVIILHSKVDKLENGEIVWSDVE